MKILFLESFFGGSHKDFALGFQDASSHDVTLLTLPDRFWKWRMRGASLSFIDQIKDIRSYDLIFATDMMDLSDFMALAGSPLPPVWLYFHENQLSYPVAAGRKRDSHLGFTNIISALAADQVFFNSQFHLDSFLSDAQKMIQNKPDFKPDWVLDNIVNKTRIIYPGCRFDSGQLELEKIDTDCPLIIWNHRWDHDKNPDPFFAALSRLKEKGIAFSLALLGESLSRIPEVFERAKEQFKDEIKIYGYAQSKQEYISWLKKGAIVVSTAIQENFGISVVEAVRYGCIPLLPNRLSYPEIMPKELHEQILYPNDQDLAPRLEDMVENYEKYLPIRQRLSLEMAQYSWQNIIKTYPIS